MTTKSELYEWYQRGLINQSEFEGRTGISLLEYENTPRCMSCGDPVLHNGLCEECWKAEMENV